MAAYDYQFCVTLYFVARIAVGVVSLVATTLLLGLWIHSKYNRQSHNMSSRLEASEEAKNLQESSNSQTTGPAGKFHPVCDKFFKDANGDSDLLVVPRKAYYDNRNAWKPNKGNVVVVLTEMSDVAHGTTTTCEINGHYTDAIDDLKEDTHWVRSRFKGHTHSLVFVFCLFVPKEAIVDGASVKLLHKGKGDSCYSRVETEYPLVVKTDFYAAPKRFGKGPNSVVVCIALFDRPPFFNEWLRYQKDLGPDLVHINADSSFAVNATHDYPFLKEALDSGFAKMEVWRNPLGKKVFWHNEILKYQDCIMRYLGVYQYAFMLDFDDFFNPVLPDHRDMKYYVNRFFKGRPKQATVYVKWLAYCTYPDMSRVPPNGNLTAAITDYTRTHRASSGYKGLHRVDGVLYVGIHNSFTRVQGFYSGNTDPKLSYVAHIRPRKQC